MRPEALKPTGRRGPSGKLRNALRSFAIVEVHPRSGEVIKIATESKTSAGPLKRLCLGRGPGIVVVRPLFSRGRMRTEGEDCQFTRDQDLCRNLLILASFEIGARVNGVLARPPCR